MLDLDIDFISHRKESVFDPNGELIDDKIRAQLTEFVRGFGEFVKAVRR